LEFRYIGKTVTIIGLVLVVSGSIFVLQSKSVIGPTSSFMHSNSEWTINGYIIVITGIILSAVGGILWWLRYSNENTSSQRI
jgi:heme/copper-type cytochrome/quinol oxidase subunit 4